VKTDLVRVTGLPQFGSNFLFDGIAGKDHWTSKVAQFQEYTENPFNSDADDDKSPVPSSPPKSPLLDSVGQEVEIDEPLDLPETVVTSSQLKAKKVRIPQTSRSVIFD
jgi:hypothetical protein